MFDHPTDNVRLKLDADISNVEEPLTRIITISGSRVERVTSLLI